MMIHVRYEGRSYDLPIDRARELAEMTDAEIRRQVARRIQAPVERIDELVVDRRPNGDVVVRPEAIYG